MKDKEVRVVIYVRISVDRTNETSTQTQEAEARKYATDRGWKVIAVKVEIGRSAYKENVKRPELESALRMVESQQATHLLVWKLDRFARSIINFHEMLGRITRSGGQFVSVTDQIDTTTTAGQIMIGLLAGLAQLESDIKRDRAISWQAGRIEKGLPNGGQRPFGYNDDYSINVKEANTLREAGMRILNGESIRGTLAALNPVGVRGKAMTARGLRSALTNPTVAGLRRAGDDYAIGTWDAIFNRAEWDALNQVMDSNRRTGETNQVAHLLSGIMGCDKCGKKMGVRKWKANPTARQPVPSQECHRYTCQGQCGNSIDEHNTNAVVMKELRERVTDRVWKEWKSQGYGYDETVIADIQRKRDFLMMKYLEGKVSETLYETQSAELDRLELISTGQEPLDLPDCENLWDSWSRLTISDKQKVIRQAFESITLNPSNGTRDPFKRVAIL
ncbi:MAG: recombinase family protein [Chitinophagaceae bacterium]